MSGRKPNADLAYIRIKIKIKSSGNKTADEIHAEKDREWRAKNGGKDPNEKTDRRLGEAVKWLERQLEEDRLRMPGLPIVECTLEVSLPSGETAVLGFQAETTLEYIHAYVARCFLGGDPAFHLRLPVAVASSGMGEKAFKTVEAEEMLQTVAEAGLVPRSALAVVMRAGAGESKESKGMG